MAEPQKVGMVGGALCLSSATVLECFGIDQATLDGWRAGGCPSAGAEWWPLAKVIGWRGLGVSAAPVELMSQRAFARLVGVSVQSINRAIKTGRLTTTVDRQLRMPEALAEWRECHASSAEPEQSDDLASIGAEDANWGQERTRQETLLAQERRLKLELERLELQGSLHHAADVEAVWADILVRFRTRILAVPSQAAPIIAGLKKNRSMAEIQAAIEVQVREALTELSQYDSVKIKAAQKRRRATKG